ncbi:dynamin family protein [Shewanella algae]|uniref:dynamin family protein n=1 Tax=Shewanella algae TaxID=38313 RepID=UPI0030068B1C|nr:dynamin family protein [Shewanella algae]
MSLSHTELLHQESVRLIKLQLDLLGIISSTPGLLCQRSEDNCQTLDPEKVKQYAEVLQGEMDKLEHLDMVLAVVGTMKSGKSTTNNAIVGLEVLPNRNRPMTALPTLIRHTPGLTAPVLTFEKYALVNEFIDELTTLLSCAEFEGQLEARLQSEDLVAVAQGLLSGGKVARVYKNESGIFEFLKGLNDLVRLASKLECEFPFEAFKAATELPVIEVEFQHLRSAGETFGRLSLLDTPGPNEAGQLALKPMMKEQLRRASGVIAVLDYTQLKSESDADVRNELLEIAEMSQGRLSVLVNKFDQKDRHSDDESAIKSLVANELLEGAISVDDVFPVSSRRAYLANRARTELALNGRLPDYQAAAWVEDFAEEALGRRWQRDIEDAGKVQEAIDALWEDSLYELPLTKVVQRAHAQAALLSIDSAASKLKEGCEKINNFLGARETALKISVDALQGHINDLKRQQLKTDELELLAQKEIACIGNRVKDNIVTAAKQASKSLSVEIDRYFKEGRISAHKERVTKQAAEKNAKKSAFSWPDYFAAIAAARKSPKNNTELDFDPNSTDIEFDNEKSAKELMKKIFKATETQYALINSAMSAAIDKVQQDIAQQSDTLERNAKSILDDLNANMNKGGFEIKLTLPKTSMVAIEIDNDKVLSNMIKEESRTESRSRRSSGAWGTVCRWFNTSDWGWETYSVEKTYYKINLKELRKKTLDGAKNVFANANVSIEQDVVKPMQESCDRFFDELKVVINQLRGDLAQGLVDKNRSREEQEYLANKLSSLKQDGHDVVVDIVELEKDTKEELGKRSVTEHVAVEEM